MGLSFPSDLKAENPQAQMELSLGPAVPISVCVVSITSAVKPAVSPFSAELSKQDRQIARDLDIRSKRWFFFCFSGF